MTGIEIGKESGQQEVMTRGFVITKTPIQFSCRWCEHWHYKVVAMRHTPDGREPNEIKCENCNKTNMSVGGRFILESLYTRPTVVMTEAADTECNPQSDVATRGRQQSLTGTNATHSLPGRPEQRPVREKQMIEGERPEGMMHAGRNWLKSRLRSLGHLGKRRRTWGARRSRRSSPEEEEGWDCHEKIAPTKGPSALKADCEACRARRAEIRKGKAENAEGEGTEGKKQEAEKYNCGRKSPRDELFKKQKSEMFGDVPRIALDEASSGSQPHDGVRRDAEPESRRAELLGVGGHLASSVGSATDGNSFTIASSLSLGNTSGEETN